MVRFFYIQPVWVIGKYIDDANCIVRKSIVTFSNMLLFTVRQVFTFTRNSDVKNNKNSYKKKTYS